MSASEIHVGDVGTVIEITVMDGATAVDISTATTKEIILLRPAGTKLTKTAIFTTTGVDGKVRYTTIAGDLDTAGVWRLQVHVVLPAGGWYSDVTSFIVHPNL